MKRGNLCKSSPTGRRLKLKTKTRNNETPVGS